MHLIQALIQAPLDQQPSDEEASRIESNEDPIFAALKCEYEVRETSFNPNTLRVTGNSPSVTNDHTQILRHFAGN
jgi:hypothetical protein